jgi:hypothetical protein
LVGVKSCGGLRVLGRGPSRECVVSGLGELKRKGVYDTYDPELKNIAKRYNAK